MHVSSVKYTNRKTFLCYRYKDANSSKQTVLFYFSAELYELILDSFLPVFMLLIGEYEWCFICVCVLYFWKLWSI